MRPVLAALLVLLAGVAMLIWSGVTLWEIGLHADRTGTSGFSGVWVWLAVAVGTVVTLIGVGMLGRQIALSFHEGRTGETGKLTRRTDS